MKCLTNVGKPTIWISVFLALVILSLLSVGIVYASVQVQKPMRAVVVVMPNTTPTLTGDVDANGVVDLLDLTLVAQDFGNSPPLYPPADINQDGTVNILDLVWVGVNFGESEEQ